MAEYSPADLFRAMAERIQAMADAMALHRIRPMIDRVFPFVQAKEAFHHMESGAHFGKIVISI